MPLLEPLVSSDFVITDVFEFATLIKERADSCNKNLMSVDIDSLSTNVPVLETINIILDRLFPINKSTVYGMNKVKIESLLKRAVTDSYFTFNDQLYRQIVGVAMGSPFWANFCHYFYECS